MTPAIPQRAVRTTLIALVLAAVAVAAGGGIAAPVNSVQGCGLINACPEIEQPKQVISALAQLTQRLGVDDPAALGKAIAQRTSIAASVAPVPGGDGEWQPVGTTPLLADDPKYSVFGEGFGKLAGRIADFDYDAAHKRLLAAVASGGVWQSTDLGAHWTSIGDEIPTQQVSSVAYTPSGGGTIIAITGDNAFGGYTYAGVGAYWTSDDGKTWHRSNGIPDGALGFKVAVDKGRPNIVFIATGAGLFRSTDTGRNFTDVDLLTGPCHGNSFQHNCFLANIVTDVVVQAKDGFGHAGGAVLAVVGWRAGTTKYPDGDIQSPGNGLYYSDTGEPGTFIDLDEDNNGFAEQVNIGRVELGEATGPDQDHGYVYAMVQDAKLFENQKVENLDALPNADPLGLGLDPTITPTYLNGVYVSADFGKTWKLVADRKVFMNPATGSGLAQLAPLGIGPGIQSWYDQWIKPDPTRHAAGIPTRLGLGLEEIWESRTTHAPIVGPTDFRTTGPYTAGGGVCIIIAAQPACSAARTLPTWTSTHPDQHAAIWIPDDSGGVTLVVGHDGGVNTQHLDATGETTQQGFGEGANNGFHTLLPYGVDIADDGIIYAGLQDNGQMRIEKDGRQVMVFGGDGIFTVVDPKNSNIVYEETPGGGVRKTIDGGVTWTSISPNADNMGFYAPLVMDELNAKHLVSGGRQIVETALGADTSSGNNDPGATAADDPTGTGLFFDPNSWINVFDLGTRLHPGQEATYDDLSGFPVVEAGDIQNQVSALGVRGNAVYAGFCGSCDPLLDKQLFHAGIATNVGGAASPKTGTANGWHIAAAKGLPQRFISSLTVGDDPKTVYVTLGISTLRPYISAKGYKVYNVSDEGGFLWKSTDGGATFFDISGNLPKIGGTWTVLRGDQLIVGSTVGVFASTTGASAAAPGKPLTFAVLGKGLPAAPVFSMSLKKNDPNTLIIGSLGRGVYRYTFTSGVTKPTAKVKGKRSTRNLPATGVATDAFGWSLLAAALGIGARVRKRGRPAER